MRLDLTIREKLVIFYITLGFIAVSMLGVYSFKSAREAILNRSFEQLTSVREVKKARLQHFFHDRIKETELLASTPELFNYTDLDSTIINTSQLDSFLLKGNYISSIHIVQPNKKLIHSKKIKQISSENILLTETEKDTLFAIAKQITNNNKTELFDYKKIYSEYSIFIASPIISNHYCPIKLQN
ncbi:MAG TPA: hypothetical protein P5243_03055 [Bacteroidales bacterium]|nr:hypothetical protein [Bacteroidales bacterium]